MFIEVSVKILKFEFINPASLPTRTASHGGPFYLKSSIFRGHPEWWEHDLTVLYI
jgi:hypothetical protein